jgi:limonene-1,2-epoxide hydrolase
VNGPEAVRTFIEAFNAEDLDALLDVLDPDVEIQASRGLVEGHDEVRAWATRKPTGELHQRLVLDAIRDEGRHVIAFGRREWCWREEGKVAESCELAIVATIGADGRIMRWQPFDDRDDALRAAGVDTGD